jgi:hypothetical protein
MVGCAYLLGNRKESPGAYSLAQESYYLVIKPRRNPKNNFQVGQSKAWDSTHTWIKLKHWNSTQNPGCRFFVFRKFSVLLFVAFLDKNNRMTYEISLEIIFSKQ